MTTEHLTDNQMIRYIHQTPDCDDLWAKLTTNDQRREVLRQAGGDTWHLDQVIQDVLDGAALSAQGVTV